MADDKKLPWGLKADALAPGSMKTISESKLKAFQVGRMNPLKGKSSAKLKEEEKKKKEEAAAAEVYAEYLASFQTAGAKAKAFVRGNVVQAGETDSSSKDAGKLYKPTSKLAELAKEFQAKEMAVASPIKQELGKKKKEKEKKKSNLEMFKEELEKQQLEREIRHKIKKGDLASIPEDVLTSLSPSYFKQGKSDATDEFSLNYGSHDVGDPTTTNLYIGNINPKMNEEMLCKVFGKYGPLASVKIMWPRTEEEKARNRNCGFVAYMSRKDGENALKDLLGQDIMGFEMKLGWGKPVPIPPQPIYVPPEMVEAQLPPPPSGLPFNAQIPSKYKKDKKEFDGNLENTVVKVVIPTERSKVSIINRVVEFVVREGPMFEAMIMNREMNNSSFRFLFENKSPDHIYYRWRLFTLLQGDTPQKWSQAEFRMFKGGSIWKPPPMNPYSMTGMSQSSQALANASSAIVHSGLSLPVQEPTVESAQIEAVSASVELEREEPARKKTLSDRQRDRLEDLLRMLTTDRGKIAELMVWCMDHADCADEIVECITESLSLEETPMSTKIARLYAVSDILYNSSAQVSHASFFRKGFESRLLEIMKQVRVSYTSAASKAQAEKFRKQVLSCLAAWQDWSVYQPGFLIKLQNVFVGLAASAGDDSEQGIATKATEDLDGFPLGKEDDELDGVPISKIDPDLDGIPLGKGDDLDGFPLSKSSTKDNIDGVPIGGSSDLDGMPISGSSVGGARKGDFIPSRWEAVPDKSSGNASSSVKSRWEVDNDDNAGQSKWQKVESSFTAISPDSDSRSGHGSPAVHGGSEIDESRRRFLRDVELKVVRFGDRLEASGGLKSGSSIKEECEKYRTRLLEEYERSRLKKAAKERKRHRSRSTSPSTPRRKRVHKGRSSRSSSVSSDNDSMDGGSDDDDLSPASSRSRKRRSHLRSRSSSRSPSPKRSSKKKKKKSRR